MTNSAQKQFPIDKEFVGVMIVHGMKAAYVHM